MLTQRQRDTFRLALASLNCYTVEKVEDLDIDDMLTDEQVVETLLGTVFQWDNVQVRKGAQRGTLYVMDFGDARAAYFTGEA